LQRKSLLFAFFRFLLVIDVITFSFFQGTVSRTFRFHFIISKVLLLLLIIFINLLSWYLLNLIKVFIWWIPILNFEFFIFISRNGNNCRCFILFLKTFFWFCLIGRHLLFLETILISGKHRWGTSLASMKSIIDASELLNWYFRICFGDLLFSIILNFSCWLGRILLLHLSFYLKRSFFRKWPYCCWDCVRQILHIDVDFSNYNYNQKKIIWWTTIQIFKKNLVLIY